LCFNFGITGNNLCHQLAKEEMLVQTNTESFTDVTMQFTPEVGFEETIKSIGTLNIYKKPCSTRSISLKRRQAQVISRDTEIKTQLKELPRLDKDFLFLF
jgi:hypothetical protein